jgi:hypothetical protein
MNRFAFAYIASVLVGGLSACGDLAPPAPAAGDAGIGGSTDAWAPAFDGGPPIVSGPDATVNDAGPTPEPEDATPAEDAGFPPGAVFGSCDPSKWVVTASDAPAVNPAAYAIDGLSPTRWSAGVPQAPGQYFQIDFGGYVMLDRLELDNAYGTEEHKDYPRGLDLVASADGTTFDKTFSSEPFVQDPGAVLTVSFAPRALRAVRLQLTGSAASWWSIHELRAGCSVPGEAPIGDAGADASIPDPGGPEISHAGWTATASSTGSSDPIASAFDGNPTTRWSTGKAQYGDEWFRLDLGQTQTFREVRLDSNDTDFAGAYVLEVSTDDATYTRVATGVGAKSTRIAFAPQTARYVRIKQIGTGITSWWCIYEAAIFP